MRFRKKGIEFRGGRKTGFSEAVVFPLAGYHTAGPDGQMVLLQSYYLLLLLGLAALCASCARPALKYFSRFRGWAWAALAALLVVVLIRLVPYVSNYGIVDSMAWRHEVKGLQMMEGVPFDFNHRFGYLFLLSIAARIVSGNTSDMHLATMVLNAIFFAGCAALIFALVLVLFDDLIAACAAASAFLLLEGNICESLTGEHRIVSLFFVLLTLVSLAALAVSGRKKIFSAMFFLSSIYAVECRLDNFHFFASFALFSILFRGRLPGYFKFVFAAALAICFAMARFSPSAGQNPSPIFSFANAVKHAPEYANFIFLYPILPALCVAGAFIGLKRHPAKTVFFTGLFVETLCFWLLSFTNGAHREVIYIYLPLCLLASVPVAHFFATLKRDRNLYAVVGVAALAGLACLIAMQMMKPEKRLSGFRTEQLRDREIRSILAGKRGNHLVLLRAEYTQIAAPGVRNPLSFKRDVIRDVAVKIKAAEGEGVESVICFSSPEKEHDCGFFELARSEAYTSDFQRNMVGEINFEDLGLRGRRVERLGKYVRVVELFP